MKLPVDLWTQWLPYETLCARGLLICTCVLSKRWNSSVQLAHQFWPPFALSSIGDAWLTCGLMQPISTALFPGRSKRVSLAGLLCILHRRCTGILLHGQFVSWRQRRIPHLNEYTQVSDFNEKCHQLKDKWSRFILQKYLTVWHFLNNVYFFIAFIFFTKCNQNLQHGSWSQKGYTCFMGFNILAL